MLGYGVGQSVYLVGFFSLNIFLFQRLIFFITRKPGFHLIPTGFFVFLHLLMNGRGVIFYFSWLLLFYASFLAKEKYNNFFIKYPFFMALSLFFSTVSTGVFFIVYIVSFSIFLGFIFAKTKKEVIQYFVFLIVLVYFSEYLLVAVQKNVDYYGGVLAVMDHGYGRFMDEWMVSLFVIASLGLGAMIMCICPSRGKTVVWLRMIGGGLLGGVLGFSILTLVIPGLVLLVSTKLPVITLRSRKRSSLPFHRSFNLKSSRN